MGKSILKSVREKLARQPPGISTAAVSGSQSGTSRNASSKETGTTSTSDAAAIPDDAPPAYSATLPLFPRPNRSSNPSIKSINTDDDPYAFLSMFDTVFIVDDSDSMSFDGRWAEVSAVLEAITPICTSHDKDGIDLYFLNHKSGAPAPTGKASNGYYNIVRRRSVETLFRGGSNGRAKVRPQGLTPTGWRLDSILRPYIDQWENSRDKSAVKPVNIIIITDGRPQDEPDDVIVQHARRLDGIGAPAYQVGLQFFQVGNDKRAKEALDNLDNELSERGIRDMVDTVSWDSNSPFRKTLTADGILKTVLGGVVRRLDRKQQ